ncbi:MAG: hypothetical protein HY372_03960 [Candidatus Andersenbacteria bacterium]|nr:hypothetical protein [Candidatus Andersenbacteria bacterium]
MELLRAQQLVAQFSGKRVLVVGDILLDQYRAGEVERLSQEAPVPILRARREEERSGGAGNVAKNLALLGAQATLVSVVGDDPAAGVLAAAAAREGYEAVLLRDASRPTIRKVRYMAGNRQLLRVDYEETRDIDGEVEQRLVTEIKKRVAGGVQAVIVSDYAKGVITRAVAEALLDTAGQYDVLVAADIKPSRASFFLGATLVAPNLREGHEFLGINYQESQVAPAELAKMVYLKMCADVYLTLGKNGIYVYCGGEMGRHVQQEHVIEVADVSGAGDTAVVVLLLSLLSGADGAEAAELANAGGAVVVSKVGSAGVSTDELLAMMSEPARNSASRLNDSDADARIV